MVISWRLDLYGLPGFSSMTILCWPTLCFPFGVQLSQSEQLNYWLYHFCMGFVVDITLGFGRSSGSDPEDAFPPSAWVSYDKGSGFVLVARKEDVYSHILFLIYKPDPIAFTAHLKPPPSRRLFTSIFVQLYQSKERIRVVAPAHPLVVLIGWAQFERALLSLQTTFERVIRERLQPKVTAVIRDQVCILQKEDVRVIILLFCFLNVTLLEML